MEKLTMLENNGCVNLVQISDIHMYEDIHGTLLGLNTFQSYCAVLQSVAKSNDPIDAIILSGDIAHDGHKQTYDRISHMLGALPYPVYVCEGNHDNPRNFKHIYNNSVTVRKERAFVKKRWQFILLNSQIPGEVTGRLSKKELAFLEARLEEYAKFYSVIFFHHHPIEVGAKWLDPLGLENADEFLALIERFPNVRAVIFGHVHQEYEGFYHRIHLFGAPSTSIQFKSKTKMFTLDIIPPAYRYLSFDEYGHIQSKIVRASHYKGYKEADMKAKGYK